MRKIVFFDAGKEDERYFKRAFKNVAGHKVICTSESLNEITVDKYSDSAIVSVFVTSEVTKKVLDKLENIELIATRSTGYDHIDTDAARGHHALVATVPTYGEVTVAEYTFALLLNLTRRLQESLQQVEDGVISYSDIVGTDIGGKTLGLLGCGKIGQHVARIARGFDMNVIGYDAYTGNSGDIRYAPLEEVLKTSDIISLHLPASEDTHHILGEKNIALTKKGALIVNTARGELIDTKALIDALYSGSVGGAALDVVEGEDLLRFDEEVALLRPEANSHDLLLKTEHSILRRMPNVVFTPHNAFNSHEALERIRHTTSENIRQFLMHAPQNIIR